MSLILEVGGSSGRCAGPRPMIRDALNYVMRSLSRRSSSALPLSIMHSAFQMTKSRSKDTESGLRGKRFWSPGGRRGES
jgi:hypothetical protein